MHKSLLLVGALALPLVNGCSNPAEERATDAIAILKGIADELATVKDAASAEAAKPRLAELGERWRANERKLSQQKLPPTSELAELEKKYGAQLESAMKRYEAEVARVKRVEGCDIALQALGDVRRQHHFRKK